MPELQLIGEISAVNALESRRSYPHGSADFPELLGHLSEFNYRGWVTIERHESPNPIPDIENAVAYLRSI